MAIIEANDVVKSYDVGDIHVRALQGISLTIERGEMVAVMGPSGSGKTTLLNCFSGIDDITSGEVIVDGQSLRDLSDRERTRYRAQNMGFVFQSYNLLPVLTAAENVELPLLLSGVGQREARGRALELLDLVGLSDQANKVPAQMSGRTTAARHYRPCPCARPCHRLGGRTNGRARQRDLGRNHGRSQQLESRATADLRACHP